jgi:hypothetical protein
MAAFTAAPRAAEPQEKGRRQYNREYMRDWRRRNGERYRKYNRDRERRAYAERRRADPPVHCYYGCGRRSVELIERVDLNTWQAFRVPYCGKC